MLTPLRCVCVGGGAVRQRPNKREISFTIIQCYKKKLPSVCISTQLEKNKKI